MKKLVSCLRPLPGAGALLPLLARASEATGTEAVADMHISGAQFLMVVGGVVLLGVVMWFVVRQLNK
ncbi:hypothetical protein [Niveibacterium sp. SC-1]|uniref:hypothetical protein n=1 Tax=Niveibacterium sp. SC-1 TaxID=3135646 RepID=UPI00311D5E53